MTPERQESAHSRGVKRQVVAGFVIYRKTHEGAKFLLLYRRGAYWNFPKGHFEQGENSFTAALREVEEETGLKNSDLRIVNGFKAYQRFHFESGEERIHDTVILYLAETKKEEIRISPREHSGFAWFFYRDALRVVGGKYVGVKKVLQQANSFLLRGRRHHRGRPISQTQQSS
ncbi:MAG: NUDIX domain-containing protein [Patescibacteria group bacterium]